MPQLMLLLPAAVLASLLTTSSGRLQLQISQGMPLGEAPRANGTQAGPFQSLVLEDMGSLQSQGVRDAATASVSRLGTSFSHELCVVLAGLWVTLLATAPFVALSFRKRIGATDKIQGCIYLFWLMLGVMGPTCGYLKFESAQHWEGSRSLDLVQTVYFLAQVITTVGYGDIVPAHPRARVFVACHILFALAIVVDVLKQEASVLNMLLQRLRKRMSEEAAAPTGVAVQGDTASASRTLNPEAFDSNLTSFIKAVSSSQEKAAEPDLLAGPRRRLQQAFAAYLVNVVIGMAFWSGYADENKSLAHGFYMSVITLSTVGFGAFIPTSEGGMVFDAYWMVIGAAALVNLVVALNDVFAAMRAQESAPQDISMSQASRMDRAEYYRFMLVRSGRVTDSEFKELNAGFDLLAPMSDGTVSPHLLDF